MPKHEAPFEVVREWIGKAENDLKNASFTLTMGDDCPTDTICFHAQQCVEKYIKAFLVWNGTPFPKTHNLPSLISLLPDNMPVLLSDIEQELLTDYATVTRYPGEMEEISISEATKAVKLARKVRKILRSLLPREVRLLIHQKKL